MNSTIVGYFLFGVAAYFLIIFGADPGTVEHYQQMFPRIVGIFVHLPGFLFVTIGILSSILISYSFREFFSAFRSLFIVFIQNKINFTNYIQIMKSIAEYVQTGDVETLEDYANSIKYPFLKDGLLMVVNGYKKEALEEILKARIENESEREEVDDDVFRALARYSPGYGMLGTTIGLIQMFTQNVDPAAGFGGIIAAMGVAFTTTLYGLIYSNFIFQPFADRVERRNAEDVILKEMILDGLIMIAEKKRPSLVEEKLTTYNPRSRPIYIPKLQAVTKSK